MKLEHRRQHLASRKQFFRRIIRFAFFAMGIVFFSVALGTIGYHHFALLNWIDSFYMASMILTGMGPVAEMPNESAKLFSSFYALYSGIAFLSMSAVFIAPFIHRLMHVLHIDVKDK